MNEITARRPQGDRRVRTGDRPLRPNRVQAVTGAARYGRDNAPPGVLTGKVLRPVPAHAHIRRIVTSAAEDLNGVDAVVTGADFPELDFACPGPERIERNFWHELRNVFPKPDKPPDIARRWSASLGDVAAGFAEANEIVALHFDTLPVHQDCIEAHACVAACSPDGTSQPWGPNRGRFRMRNLTAKMSGMSPGVIRAEAGGGLGGKTKVYLGPVAMQLPRKAGLPVRMMMSREKVFRATGPDSDPRVRVKVGPRRDGTLTAAEIKLCYDTGAFPGAPFINGVPCAFSRHAFPNPHGAGYHVVANRATTAAYRAPGAMQSRFAAEGALDVLAKRIGMDPLELRLKKMIRVGDAQIGDRQTAHEGCAEIVEALRAHPADTRRLGPNQRRRVTSGIWHNGSGQYGTTCLTRRDNSRTSMATMAASTCGMPYERDLSESRDIASVRFGDVTWGSRVTSATGKAIHDACTRVITQRKERAANGAARPSSSKAGEFNSLTLAELAEQAGAAGGHLSVSYGETMSDHAAGLCAMVCNVQVDPDPGIVEILEFVTAQNAGRAIQSAYVIGQTKGAVGHGICWALNAGNLYGADSALQNASWRDYWPRVAADLPMAETVIVAVPNPQSRLRGQWRGRGEHDLGAGLRGQRGLGGQRAADRHRAAQARNRPDGDRGSAAVALSARAARFTTDHRRARVGASRTECNKGRNTCAESFSPETAISRSGPSKIPPQGRTMR
jgi:CO/xanthine dehydrogenase Mo-binding subunit